MNHLKEEWKTTEKWDESEEFGAETELSEPELIYRVACPVEGKALSFEKGRNNPPVYHYRKCIRCFCCQEMCPFQAIGVR